ncbi:D123-domain-containing protein [Xylariomycetidae sp. FL2044]|nr:D123-domain-containing protein [Xylariomycetidae sp. FL2044]
MPMSTTTHPAPSASSSEPQFPPITRDHILHCSYDYWFPKYRASCIKSRIIPLSPEFIEYIREDGIILADDDVCRAQDDDWESSPVPARPEVAEQANDSDSEGESDGDDDEPGRSPPNHRFPDLHQLIADKIAELGGASLVLRSYFNPHTAIEFRCFVQHRNLIAISQRDLNFFAFLKSLSSGIVARIYQLFNHKLRYTYPDGSFVFDVYIPDGEDEPLGRARLIDINPWAPHTDSLLFTWQELLHMDVPGPILGVAGQEDDGGLEYEGMDDSGEEEDDFVPELRLIEKDEPSRI